MGGDKLAIAGGTPSVPASLHVRWPVIGEADKAAVMAVLERGVLSGPFAPEVRGFEEEYAAYAGRKYALATNSGTAALHIALAAAGVGPGDEVLTPAFSFVASALAVLHQTAIPVFVDIEPRTFNIDPVLLEKAITPRTKAIVPVHIHGMPYDVDAVHDIARRHGLVVIEDACQSHGATYGGRRVGTFGAMAAFSLQSSKNLSCGEGGMFVTDDEALLDRANRTRMFGENVRLADATGYRIERALDGNRAYDSGTMGWMYRMNEMSAALGRNQLRHLDHWNLRSQQNAAIISRRLSSLPGITPPVPPEGRTSIFHKYRVRLDASRLGIDASPKRVRDAMRAALSAEGMDVVLWQTMPVPSQGLFREKLGYGRTPGASDGAPGLPWSLGAPVDYSLEQYPETTRLLDSSLCLFSHTCPIAPQPPELCEAYAEAFARVWLRLDEALAATATAG